MEDDQRKGERLRSGDGGGGLSFLLGLVFFSMCGDGDHLPLVSLGFWDQSSGLMGHDDGGDER